jgi:hypothetical protein
MKCPGIDFPLPDFFSLSGMATMDTGMEVYQTGVSTVQGVCVVHDLQLRLNKVSVLRITRGRSERFAFSQIFNKQVNKIRLLAPRIDAGFAQLQSST